MEIKQRFFQFINFISTSGFADSDIRDIFVFTGMFYVGYGLWLLSPWIGFTVGGVLLMLVGLLMKGK